MVKTLKQIIEYYMEECYWNDECEKDLDKKFYSQSDIEQLQKELHKLLPETKVMVNISWLDIQIDYIFNNFLSQSSPSYADEGIHKMKHDQVLEVTESKGEGRDTFCDCGFLEGKQGECTCNKRYSK